MAVFLSDLRYRVLTASLYLVVANRKTIAKARSGSALHFFTFEHTRRASRNTHVRARTHMYTILYAILSSCNIAYN